MGRVLLGLGTNLGDREAQLAEALLRLGAFVDIRGVSSVYRTEPIGFRQQPDFLNLVVSGHTSLDPEELAARARAIETAMGRRPAFRNAPRVIDIDILLYDDRVIATPDLEIPHPRMLERAFVLRPLVEVEPDTLHPVTRRRFAEHLAEGEDRWERTERLFPGRRLLEKGGPGD